MHTRIKGASAMNTNGAIIYRGPSRLDGKPIVVVVTGLKGSSGNTKTGDLLQTWILCDEDEAPNVALKSGSDYSICGDCKHRRDPETGRRTCYVRMQAPPAVWKAYRRGSYPDVSGDGAAIAALGNGRKVRLGSYGDPGAVPYEVWSSLVSEAPGHTGYTHQWNHWNYDARISRLCMISADTETEVRTAEALGLRAFHVRPRNAPKPANTAQCPAAAEAGKRVQCADCMLCGGTSVKARSISIEAHGASAAFVQINWLRIQVVTDRTTKGART